MVIGLTWDGRLSPDTQIQVDGLRGEGQPGAVFRVDVDLRWGTRPIGYGLYLLLSPEQAASLRDGLTEALREKGDA